MKHISKRPVFDAHSSTIALSPIAFIAPMYAPRSRLPLLWLDWSGARVSSIDLTLVGDYDEPRRRVRLRAATTKTRKAL